MVSSSGTTSAPGEMEQKWVMRTVWWTRHLVPNVFDEPIEGDSTPVVGLACYFTPRQENARLPTQKWLSSPIRMTSRRRLTRTHPSSMIQPAPMTMGPDMAKRVALGWMTVFAPMVMSPLRSTS